jgi:hypothetical protein
MSEDELYSMAILFGVIALSMFVGPEVALCMLGAVVVVAGFNDFIKQMAKEPTYYNDQQHININLKR